MYFDQETLKDAEHRIKQYYKNLYEIGRLKNKLPILHKRKDKIQYDIDNNNIYLEYEVSSSDYSADRVQTSFTGSQQEQAINNAYRQLESEIHRINNEIIAIENNIIRLECANSDMEYIIRNLSTQHRYFIEAKYKEHKSVSAISQDLFISRTTAYILKSETVAAVALCLTYPQVH